MLTPERIEEIEGRHKSATAGPYTNCGYDPKRGHFVAAGIHKYQICQIYGTCDPGMAKATKRGTVSDDAAFLAHSWSDIANLLAEVKAAREREAVLRSAARALFDAHYSSDPAAITRAMDGMRAALAAGDAAETDHA